jgi:hypothetical protein
VCAARSGHSRSSSTSPSCFVACARPRAARTGLVAAFVLTWKPARDDPDAVQRVTTLPLRARFGHKNHDARRPRHASSPHASFPLRQRGRSDCAAAGLCASQAGEDEDLHRRRRQGGVLLPASHHLRTARLLQGRRARGGDLRFRRRRARAAGAWWAARPMSCSGAYEHTINLQAKNQFFQAFVLQGRAPQIAVGVSTKNMAGYTGMPISRARRSASRRRARRPTWWPTSCFRAAASRPAT